MALCITYITEHSAHSTVAVEH